MTRALLALIAAATVALACAGAATAQEELKIGAVGSLSGGGTAWGLAIQRGTQMAIDEVNAAGGLKLGDKTYKPRLVMYDDQYTSTGGKTAAERLVNSDGVKFILGPAGSPPALAVIGVTNPAKVIVLSDGYAPAILKNEAKAAYNFRALNSNVEFTPAMIAWLKQNMPEVKKIGLVCTNDAVGQAALPLLIDAYKKAGYEVWSELYDRGTKEFTPLMTRMIAQGVDLFDLNFNAPTEAGLLLKQARQAGYKGRIWQVGGPSVDEIMAVAGPLADGFLSYDVFDFDSPAAAKFVATYHKQWPGIINAQAPAWYNAAKVLFEAMRRAGTTDVDKVRDALEKLDGYDAGLFGPVRWGGMADYGVNHQLLLKFLIVEVKDGKRVTRAELQPEQR
ncbi:MAG TPA: ABC transporter substrate-binding protein [Stellaceae bacterium]|nr:ABC transporter substrate-binding protein [Stellaceae bacterium]